MILYCIPLTSTHVPGCVSNLGKYVETRTSINASNDCTSNWHRTLVHVKSEPCSL